MIALVMLSGLVPGHRPGDAAAQAWYMVHDRAGLLDEQQERSAIDDAFRLNRTGIPTQVVIEPLALDQSRADDRADELRITHGIESSPGADDGLLIYLSVDPVGSMASVISFSIGAHTTPAGGLTRGDVEAIRETIAIPQLAAGHPARAIVYSLREMIYQHMFTPPPAPAVPERNGQVQSALVLAGPVLTLLVAGLLQPWRTRQGRGWLVIVACVGAGTLLFGIAVLGRSEFGILGALAVLLLAVWSAVTRDSQQCGSHSRHVYATPRPPGRKVAFRNLFRIQL